MFGCRWPQLAGELRCGWRCLPLHACWGCAADEFRSSPGLAWRQCRAGWMYCVDVWRKKGGVDDTEVKAGRR